MSCHFWWLKWVEITPSHGFQRKDVPLLSLHSFIFHLNEPIWIDGGGVLMFILACIIPPRLATIKSAHHPLGLLHKKKSPLRMIIFIIPPPRPFPPCRALLIPSFKTAALLQTPETPDFSFLYSHFLSSFLCTDLHSSLSG